MKRALSRKNLWENAPWGLKSSLGRILAMVPVRLLLGKRFVENHAFAREVQWWPAERSHEFQLHRLRDMLQLAYERTEFYRWAFDAVGFRVQDFRSTDDMSRLRTIDKKDVIENLSAMCTKSTRAFDVDCVSTGGTSGTPLHFYVSAKRSAVAYAYLVSSWERAGYWFGAPMAVLRGRPIHRNRHGLHYEYDPVLRHHYYSSFHMTDETMAGYLKHIETLGPCFLHVYPSTIAALSRFVRRSRREALLPRAPASHR